MIARAKHKTALIGFWAATAAVLIAAAAAAQEAAPGPNERIERGNLVIEGIPEIP